MVTDAGGLEEVGARDRRVLGMFNAGNMSLEWDGEPATPEPGSGPQRCDEDQRPADEPSVDQMTTKAIELLDRGLGARGRGQSPGFFLQVEGASIDKQDHAANPCGQIGEHVAFDEAVGVALDYANRNRDTLVLVTGDHSHTSQIMPTGATSPGKVSTLETADGEPMKLNYATSAEGSQTHTGSQIRVAGQGPQAANVVGVTDQPDLFDTMARAIRAR